MNYQTILTKLEHWKQKDDERISAVRPDGNFYYGNNLRLVAAYLDNFDDILQEWLNFYIYEVPTIKGRAPVSGKNGIQYDAKDRNQFIEFLESLDKKKAKE